MSLINDPKVLFLDEPTLGLDVIARKELWDIIGGLKGKMTTILTTHYMEEAEALSDRIGIMADGRLIAVGTAAELKDMAGTESFEDAFVAIATGKAASAAAGAKAAMSGEPSEAAAPDEPPEAATTEEGGEQK